MIGRAIPESGGNLEDVESARSTIDMYLRLEKQLERDAQFIFRVRTAKAALNTAKEAVSGLDKPSEEIKT